MGGAVTGASLRPVLDTLVPCFKTQVRRRRRRGRPDRTCAEARSECAPPSTARSRRPDTRRPKYAARKRKTRRRAFLRHDRPSARPTSRPRPAPWGAMLRARRRGLPLNYLLNFILNLPFGCCLAGKWGFGQSPFDSCCNQLYDFLLLLPPPPTVGHTQRKRLCTLKHCEGCAGLLCSSALQALPRVAGSATAMNKLWLSCVLRDLSALKYECAGPASTVRLTRPFCLTLPRLQRLPPPCCLGRRPAASLRWPRTFRSLCLALPSSFIGADQSLSAAFK